jgi:hypothetical protein
MIPQGSWRNGAWVILTALPGYFDRGKWILAPLSCEKDQRHD